MPEKHKTSSDWVPLKRDPKQRNPLVFKPLQFICAQIQLFPLRRPVSIHLGGTTGLPALCYPNLGQYTAPVVSLRVFLNTGVDDKILS